jgi:hypothetical protein
VPLAAAGIACLGLVPTLGGPDRPLHWAMTAGMVGFGALLFVRHRLVKREGALRPVSAAEARHAGATVLILTGISALLVLGIVGLQWRRGGDIGLLSLAMPVVGLLWLGSLGVLSRRHRVDPTADPVERSSSLRGAKLDALSTPSPRPSRPPTDRRISA